MTTDNDEQRERRDISPKGLAVRRIVEEARACGEMSMMLGNLVVSRGTMARLLSAAFTAGEQHGIAETTRETQAIVEAAREGGA